MRQLSLIPTILFLILYFGPELNLADVGAGNGTGTLTWGQACNPSAALQDDQSTRCDTSKRLSCGMNLKTCKCHHEERDIYNSQKDRCESKVGKFCSSSDTFPTICVENAVCDAITSFCRCEHGAEENAEGTACIKEEDDENSAVSNYLHLGIAILAIGGLWL